jgi:hypothetical protein
MSGHRRLPSCSGNYQVLEEFLTARSKKSKKFLLSSPFFTFFSSTSFTFSHLIDRAAVFLAVNFFFKVFCYKRNFDAGKSKRRCPVAGSVIKNQGDFSCYL